MSRSIYISRTLSGIMTILALTYPCMCLFLVLRQRNLIFNPSYQTFKLPSDSEFKMPYENAWIPVPGTQSKIHGWWIPPANLENRYPIAQRRSPRDTNSPQVVLFLPGAGGNKSKNLWTVKVFHKLGLATLAIDYRGYGQSYGNFPSEPQLYQDSQAAWNYLTQVRRIPPQQILIYGQSLGGAIALNLAIEQPKAGALVMQSTFTSMSETVKRLDRFPFWLFPIDLMLTERFNSIDKVRSLQIPVLFIHGSADSLVPADMSQRLYQASDRVKRKQILLIPKAGHYPSSRSYVPCFSSFIWSSKPLEYRQTDSMAGTQCYRT